MKKITFTLIALIIAVASFAQNFEGKITATVKALKVPAEMQGMESMMNQDITITSKDSKTKTEMKSIMGSQVIIFDTQSKMMTILMDMMGQKYAISQKVEDDAEASSGIEFELKGADIKITDEKKKIGGYNCKKALATIPDESGTSITMEFWFTEEISMPNNNLPFSGTMMEYTVEVEGMTLQYSVTGVAKQTVAPSEFDIPAGYQIKTMEEMNELFPTMGNE